MSITRAEGALVSDKPLFATVDGRLVDEGDPEANTLVASAGLPIPAEVAEKYGITEGGSHKAKKVEPVEPAEPPAAEQPTAKAK